MMLGIGADGDRVGLEGGERFGQAFVTRQAGEFLVEIMPGRGVAGAEAYEVEAFDRPIGAGVAQPHGAKPDDENALPLHAGAFAISHSCAGSL